MIRVIDRIDEMHSASGLVKAAGKKIGFTPTMGCLHGGHQSLIKRSVEENDFTVVSIFVNPAQFGQNEDFKQYPRDLNSDALLAEAAGADCIFSPSVEDMYPAGYGTFIEVRRLSSVLCGRSRPGHFTGVATVVAKLLNICRPDALYLGQKDAQQAVILKKMVFELNMKVKVRVLPTVRENDGLAMSSRNSYLTPEERKKAPLLYKALVSVEKLVRGGETDANIILKKMKFDILSIEGAELDYAEIVSAAGLEPVCRIDGPAVAAAAVKIGKARLIDNILLNCSQL